MLFSIGNKGCKLFLKALRFLARYSNELFIEATDNNIKFKAVSNTQSLLAILTFENNFFVQYEIGQSNDSNKVKVSLRPLLACLKNIKMVRIGKFNFE